jgi:hypothetical protein
VAKYMGDGVLVYFRAASFWGLAYDRLLLSRTLPDQIADYD